MGGALTRMTSGSIGYTFLSLAEIISLNGCFAIFALMGVVAVVFRYRMLPETTRYSVEQMATWFEDPDELSRRCRWRQVEQREVIRAKIRKERQIGRGFNHHVIEDDNDVWGTTSTK